MRHYRHFRMIKDRRSLRGGFTVLELLTVTSVVGVLSALILPAVQQSREAARRLQCTNNLKQIGLALHNYHETNQSLPPGWQFESSRRSAYGWSVPLLPFLKQVTTFQRVNRNVVVEALANDEVRRITFAGFRCPSDISEPTFLLYADEHAAAAGAKLVRLPTANYAGVFGTSEPDKGGIAASPAGEGAFPGTRSVSYAEFRRGLSRTVIVGERTMARVPSTWLGVDALGEDAACRLVGNALTSPNCDECDECEFDSRHPGCANFLWGDGHVKSVKDSIDVRLYQQLARRTGL